MTGGRDFDPARFVGIADYIVGRGGPMPSERLAWIMFASDFKAYAQLGESITGATWLKGDQHPECREAGIGWFRTYVRARTPWWAKLGGWLATAWVLKEIVWREP